jgi:hypothetical protein
MSCESGVGRSGNRETEHGINGHSIGTAGTLLTSQKARSSSKLARPEALQTLRELLLRDAAFIP